MQHFDGNIQKDASAACDETRNLCIKLVIDLRRVKTTEYLDRVGASSKHRLVPSCPEFMYTKPDGLLYFLKVHIYYTFVCFLFILGSNSNNIKLI